MYFEKLKSEELYPRYIAEIANQSLILELLTEPKPGLVTRSSNGSHKDMNYKVFIDSIKLLEKYWYAITILPYNNNNTALIFQKASELGKEYELKMLEATGNVNTHKGLIFSMGVLTLSVSYLAFRKRIFFLNDISRTIRFFLNRFYKEKMEKKTAGDKFRKVHYRGGVISEAFAGFPTVFNNSLPFFMRMNNNLSFNEASSRTLVYLISITKDTNLWNRGKEEGLRFARRVSSRLGHSVNGNRNPGKTALTRMCKSFIDKNLSPGGSADLLALTIFLYLLIKKDLKNYS
ncbi:MAG: triphosphoribosyl-dephospho-CoA synthase [Candidatus Coatesbacteria bacterium]|nr:triphosphoribosyl-dephospho-CoA synthase [Candidatus Coatesbacteria bacterium]